MTLTILLYILKIIAIIGAILLSICILVFIVGCTVKAIYWLAKVIRDPDEPLPEPPDDWME